MLRPSNKCVSLNERCRVFFNHSGNANTTHFRGCQNYILKSVSAIEIHINIYKEISILCVGLPSFYLSPCFSTRSRICFSTASSSSCTECSSNASSPALKGRHIKASNSETMVMCVNRVLAVLASLVAAALAVLTGYKLIANSGNQNKTSDNKAL